MTGKTNFHTYSVSYKKTHGFVIYVYPIKTQCRLAYLMITSLRHTLRGPRHITRVDHVKIHWERHFNDQHITQCHRSHEWGHATGYCFKSYKGLKCEEGYDTVY